MQGALVLLLAAPAAAFAPPAATRGARFHSTPRGGSPTARHDPPNPLARLPVPSIYTMAYLAIIGLTARDLSQNAAVKGWLAGGAPLSELPLQALSGGAVLVSFAAFQLAQLAGVGKRDYYGELEGFEVDSLAAQAAEWALAGEVPTRSSDGKYDVASFAGGCFWGTELHFQRVPGVIATCVGYTQGRTEKPSYGEVCSGTTGHTEGLQLLYDPQVVSYGALCDKLFQTIDSTAWNRVGNDIGTQYRHGIYPHTDSQMQEALAAIEREQARKDIIPGAAGMRKVVTEVKQATVFWPAETKHQRYLQKRGQSAAKGETAEVRCYG